MIQDSARQLLLLLPACPEHPARVAGSSVPGTCHRRHNQACQDAYGWFDTSSGLVAMAAADGAGSARQAALGSAVAVRAALLSILDTHLKYPITASSGSAVMALAFWSALYALREEAAAMGTSMSDLACTLAIVVATREFAFAAHVGDGAVVTREKSGDILTLSPPTNGEFANETILLGCRSSVDVSIWSYMPIALSELALFTDGIQRLALGAPNNSPHPGFFHPLFDQLRGHAQETSGQLITNFLNSPRVTTRTDDDKTLVVAHLL